MRTSILSKRRALVKVPDERLKVVKPNHRLLAMDEQLRQHGFAEKEASPTRENVPEQGVEMQIEEVNPRSTVMSPCRWAVLCFSMLIAMIQAALDSTITADLQPTIIDSLGEISKFPWINVTYSLGLGGSCLLW